MKREHVMIWFSLCLGLVIGSTVVGVGIAARPHAIVFGGPSEERDSIVAWEARRVGMSEPLAIAISHVENWAGDSTVVHPRSGAIGLMQVMPFWADSFRAECGDGTLVVRQYNACAGARIAKRYFDECGDWDCALRWYVGARCTARDTPWRCTQKQKTGTEYVLAVIKRYGRDDLSPARDAMALGGWRGELPTGSNPGPRHAQLQPKDSLAAGASAGGSPSRVP